MPEPGTITTEAEAPSEMTAAEPWYAKDGFTEDQLPTVSRYKTREAFNAAFFEQRKVNAAHVPPPDATKLKPDEYVNKLKEYRQRGGGLTEMAAVKVEWPEDLAAFIEGKAPKLTQTIKESAVNFGLSQIEVDAHIQEYAKEFRSVMESEEAGRQDAEKKKNKDLADADKLLSDLWMDAKEQNTANAMLAVEKFDQSLFAKDNDALTDEEIADRGGKLAQDIRNMEPDVRQRFLRLFHNLHYRLFRESPGSPGGEGGGPSNLYNDRLAKAKLQYPKRPELWDQLARSSAEL